MRRVTLIITLLFGCFALVGGSATAKVNGIPKASKTWKACGSLDAAPVYVIRAKKVKCGEARLIARESQLLFAENQYEPVSARGFFCKTFKFYGDGVVLKCSQTTPHGKREVRYAVGG